MIKLDNILLQINNERSKSQSSSDEGYTNGKGKTADTWPDAEPLSTPGEPHDEKRPKDIEPANLLGVEPVPPFPVDFLHSTVSRFILDQSTRMGCPTDFVGIPLIIAFATVIGKHFRLAPKANDQWTERACLWGANIGPVGVLKSPAYNLILGYIAKLQAGYKEQYDKQFEEYLIKRKVASVAEKEWKKEAAAAIRDGGEPPDPPKKPPEPVLRRIVTSDVTQERLVEMMQNNTRGIALFRDELAGFFASLNQYRQGADEQFYLHCHAGGSWSQDRKSGDYAIDDLFLCMYGGFQPEVVRDVLLGRKLAGTATSIENGMAARLSLLVWPDRKDWTWVDEEPDRDACEGVERIFRKLLSFEPEQFVGPKRMNEAHYEPFRFTFEAVKIFQEWLTAHKHRLNKLDERDPIRGHFSKYDGLFARLSIVHHLVRHAAGEPVELDRVDEHTARPVRDFIENYLRPHALKIYWELGRGAAYHGARRIAQWITDNPEMTTFKARDITRKAWRDLTEPRAVADAIFYLENVAGWITSVETPPGPRGGRPTVSYQVDPRVHGLNKKYDS